MDLTDKTCCQETKKYSEEYDCFYCDTCNKWTEDKCDDPTCEYCTTRPETPNQFLQALG